jgi:hypothetical protein
MTENAAELDCDCCDLGEYDPAPYDGPAVPGSCLNCGHSPQEHGC